MAEFQVPGDAGWFEKHVVESLGRLERNVESLSLKVSEGEREVSDVREKVARLEERVAYRAAFIGAVVMLVGWLVKEAL